MSRRGGPRNGWRPDNGDTVRLYLHGEMAEYDGCLATVERPALGGNSWEVGVEEGDRGTIRTIVVWLHEMRPA